jgi:fatty acid desaturase
MNQQNGHERRQTQAGKTMNMTYESRKPEQVTAHDRPRIATPVKLSKAQLSELSRVNPLISACFILREWTAVILAILLCQHFWNPVIYLVAVAFIGARQHALLILMHDGTHYRLFRNHRVNDWITEVLLAWPHLVTMRSYRENHLAHHNFVNTDKDPDWVRKQGNAEWGFPQSAKSLLWIFLRDLCGIGGINLIRLASSLGSAARVPSKAFVRVRLAFYVAVIGALVTTGCGKALIMYWVVPYFTWLIFIMRIRSIAEHFAINGGAGAYGQTRTTHAGLLARLFVAPNSVNYHIEHHFFPSVPFFRLSKLHTMLMATEEFASAAHISQSYTKMLLECMRQSASSESAEGVLGAQTVSLAMADS